MTKLHYTQRCRVHRTIVTLLFILLKIKNISSTPTCPAHCSTCMATPTDIMMIATCTDAMIQSLPGSLEQLHVKDAGPMTLPLGKLQGFVLAGKAHLRVLTMQNYRIAQIQDRALKQCPKLETLDLSTNIISTIGTGTFTGLTHLAYLKLDKNQITDVSPKAFKDLVSLKELNLSENRLTIIRKDTFVGLSNLTKLDLHSNMIWEIEPGTFSGLHKLESINLARNNLTNIQPGAFSNLLSSNLLSMQGSSLSLLNLSQNQFQAIPTGLLQQISSSQLEVNLAKNQITSINNGDLKYVVLKTLHLVANELDLVQPDALQDSFIQKLNLQQNKLQRLPDRMLLYLNQSVELLLSNNLWVCDCDIQWLTSILKDDSTVCTEPSHFKGWPIRQIKNDLQVTCNNPASIPVPTRKFPVPPQQDLITPVLKNQTAQYQPFMGDDSEGSHSNKAVIVAVIAVVTFLFLVTMVIVIALMSRSRAVSDLNITCRKPDANFRQRLPKMHNTEVVSMK